MDCRLCFKPIPPDKVRCTSCGAINVGGAVQTLASNFDDGSVLLSDVVSADNLRLDVGEFNRIFGGPILNPEEVEEGEPEENGPGLVCDSVTIIAGAPGAGKSTAILKMVNTVIELFKREKEAIIIASEESLPQIKARAVRTGIKNIDKIRMVPAMSGGADIGSILMYRKPCIAFIDSLAGLVGEDDNASVEVCKICKQYAEKLNCPILLTQHMTKGEEVAGVNTIQHAVDTVLIFTVYDEEANLREIETNPKNRFGRAFIKMYMVMDGEGLKAMPNGWEPDEEE